MQVWRDESTFVNSEQPAEVFLEDVHDEADFLRVYRGCTVQRETEEGPQRGVVGKVTNWRWANVWWARADGTTFVEKTWLVGLKWVRSVKGQVSA